MQLLEEYVQVLNEKNNRFRDCGDISVKTGVVQDNFLKEAVLLVSLEVLAFDSGVLFIGPVVWFCWPRGIGESTWDFRWLFPGGKF